MMIDLFRQALQSASPVSAVEALLEEHPELPAATGQAWSDGFFCDHVPAQIAALLVRHGAPLSVHAAAGFGFTGELAAMLDADPALVHAKGGDGCTPLHFARDLATAQLLIARGAHMDARDDDHDSTPAQWRIGKAPEVARYLLECGATPDIFLAAALGDAALTTSLIAANPACPAHRIGRSPDFPPIGHQGRGGTILQWTLAFNSYPHQVALLKGHQHIFDLLYHHSDVRTRLLVNCVLGRRPEAEAIATAHPELIPNLDSSDLELPALYCWETNTNLEAVRLMLDLGFPVAHLESNHGYSPLHNAAWSGNAALVDLLLSRGHPVDLVDPRYNSTALGYAIHDCVTEKRHPEGEFAHVVRSLLRAGSTWTPGMFPCGDAKVDAVFHEFQRERA